MFEGVGVGWGGGVGRWEVGAGREIHYVDVNMHLFFWHAVLGRQVFFVAKLSAAGQARGASVQYDPCLDPNRAL